MRKIAIILSLIFILFSCKKDNVFPGQWKWVETSGGISGGIIAKPSADSVVTLTLKDDFTYKGYLNNQLKAEGNYTFFIVQNNDTVIHFDQNLQIGKFFLSGDKGFSQTSNSLYFSDYNISDGYTSEFDRIR